MYLFGEHGKDRLHVYLTNWKSEKGKLATSCSQRERIKCQIQVKDQRGNML